MIDYMDVKEKLSFKKVTNRSFSDDFVVFLVFLIFMLSLGLLGVMQ